MKVSNIIFYANLENHDYNNYEEEKEPIVPNHKVNEYHFHENWNEKEEKKDKKKKKEKMNFNPFTDSQYEFLSFY